MPPKPKPIPPKPKPIRYPVRGRDIHIDMGRDRINIDRLNPEVNVQEGGETDIHGRPRSLSHASDHAYVSTYFNAIKELEARWVPDDADRHKLIAQKREKPVKRMAERLHFLTKIPVLGFFARAFIGIGEEAALARVAGKTIPSLSSKKGGIASRVTTEERGLHEREQAGIIAAANILRTGLGIEEERAMSLAKELAKNPELRNNMLMRAKNLGIH
ncbi:MAG: hypothetical protein ABIA76_05960 [Candidatus Diapherotrites archaeon]